MTGFKRFRTIFLFSFQDLAGERIHAIILEPFTSNGTDWTWIVTNRQKIFLSH